MTPSRHRLLLCLLALYACMFAVVYVQVVLLLCGVGDGPSLPLISGTVAIAVFTRGLIR